MTQVKATPIPAWIEEMLPTGHVEYSLGVDATKIFM